MITCKMKIIMFIHNIETKDAGKYFFEYLKLLYGIKLTSKPIIKPSIGIPIKKVLIYDLLISSFVAT